MTILEIPYAYRATLVPSGHRNPHDFDVLDTVPVKIETIADADAPVVARCQHATRRYTAAGFVNDLHDLDYRLVDDRLMRRLQLPNGHYTVDSYENVTADDAQTAILRWIAKLIERRGGWSANPFVPEPDSRHRLISMNRISVRHRISNDREASRAAAVRDAAGSAVINGTLYVPSRGPALEVDDGYYAGYQNDRSVHEVRLMVRPEFGHFPSKARVYSGDQAELARLMAVRRSRELGRDVGADVGAIEFPEGPSVLLSLDDHKRALRVAAAELLALSADHVLSLEASAIRSYAEVKEGLTRAPSDDPVAFNALLMAAIDLNERWCAARRADPQDPSNPVARFRERWQRAQQCEPSELDDADLDAPAPGL